MAIVVVADVYCRINVRQREKGNAHFCRKRNQRELGIKDYSPITKVLEEPLLVVFLRLVDSCRTFSQLIQFPDKCSATISKYEPFPSSAQCLGDLCATLPASLSKTGRFDYR